MNVRIQYDIQFPGGIYTEEGLFLNNYSANLSLVTVTNDKVELNIAMKRLECFVYSILKDTVFIHQDRKDHAALLHMMGVNITTLPEEPVDQVIGMMLYCKLNAIMEGRLVVTEVSLTSDLGEDVWYLHNEDEGVGPFKPAGWWNNPNTVNHSIEFDDENKKIVKVPSDSWADYDLLWPDATPPTGNIVVYANFGKNEDNSVQ